MHVIELLHSNRDGKRGIEVVSFRYMLVAGSFGLAFVNRRPSIAVTAESAVVRDTVGDGFEWKLSNTDSSLMASSASNSTSATNGRYSYPPIASTARARDDEITVLQDWTKLLSAESMGGPVRWRCRTRLCSSSTRVLKAMPDDRAWGARMLCREKPVAASGTMMVTTAGKEMAPCVFEGEGIEEVSSQRRGLGHSYRTGEGGLRRRGTAVESTDTNSGYKAADGSDRRGATDIVHRYTKAGSGNLVLLYCEYSLAPRILSQEAVLKRRMVPTSQSRPASPNTLSLSQVETAYSLELDCGNSTWTVVRHYSVLAFISSAKTAAVRGQCVRIRYGLRALTLAKGSLEEMSPNCTARDMMDSSTRTVAENKRGEGEIGQERSGTVRVDACTEYGARSRLARTSGRCRALPNPLPLERKK